MSEKEKKAWEFDMLPSPLFLGEGCFYHCYMSSDPILIEDYLFKKGMLFPSSIQWKLYPEADPAIVQKMAELDVLFALCTVMSADENLNTGIVDAYWREEGQIWHVSGVHLRDPEEQVVIEKSSLENCSDEVVSLIFPEWDISDFKSSQDIDFLLSIFKLVSLHTPESSDVKRVTTGGYWGYRGILLLKEMYGDKFPYFPFLDQYKRPVLFGDKIQNGSGDFFTVLRRYREFLGVNEVAMYKAADLSRQVYSKIKSGKSKPKRETVMSFAVALNLSAKDTEILLSSAGFSFRMEDALSVIDKAIEIFSDKFRFLCEEYPDFAKALSDIELDDGTTFLSRMKNKKNIR